MEISKTEYQVLDVLWTLAPCSANDIVEELNKEQDWHEKTVKTLLSRLLKKEAITFTKQGREYIYSPLVSKKDYQGKESQSFIKRLFKGKVSPLVAAFAENESLSKEDIDELKQLIDSWEEAKDND